MKDKYVEEDCFICKQIITSEQMDNDEVEMITGPMDKKVFVHNNHVGVKKEVKEEFGEEK